MNKPQDEPHRNSPTHTVNISERRVINISGAEDVLSFDENSVVISTGLGIMSIDGENLRILKLNTDGDGTLIVEGTIGGVFYVDENASSKKKTKAAQNKAAEPAGKARRG